MLVALTVCTILTALVTALPLSRYSIWIVRGMDFPRLQIMTFALGLLVCTVWWLDLSLPATWILLSVTSLCFLWQMWWILPYTPLWRKEVQPFKAHDREKELSIIISNVLATNRNAEPLIALVKKYQPDVLVTLESDHWWQEQLEVLESDMPYTVKCPLDNLYGMHVYSTLPLHDSEICFLVEQDVPSIHASIELRTGDQVRAHFLHPAPPSPTENEESTERDAELIVVARSIDQCQEPVLVTGDLNDVAWSATTRLFRKISGLLDPRIGRGMFNTFHAEYPLLRWPLDHLFHSVHFSLREIQLLPYIGSDHFPLFTTLVFTPSARSSQEQPPAADQEDHERAKEIVDQKEVSQHDVPEPKKNKPTPSREVGSEV